MYVCMQCVTVCMYVMHACRYTYMYREVYSCVVYMYVYM